MSASPSPSPRSRSASASTAPSRARRVAAWNFFKFNVNEGGSAAYGTHPWHWYLTQGFPAVATVFAPLAALGCVSGTLKGARAWEPFAVAGYCVLGHSLAAHKEFRFLMPALPPTLAAAGGALAAWQTEPKTAWRTRRAVALVLLTQIPAAAYLSWWHQSGTVAAVRHVAALAAAGETRAGGVFFATPCHQHPFHTHAHLPSRVPVPMSFLECPPASAEGRASTSRTRRTASSPTRRPFWTTGSEASATTARPHTWCSSTARAATRA